jgi:pimeloyl-ACP methyl ester carboxylesterase
MADDSMAVLDALEIPKAHIVGASMGGMIAQIIAAEYPHRSISLVSIMSTTGAPHLPEAEASAQDDLQGLADTEGDATAQMNEIGIYPAAMPRQLMAIIAAGDRSEQVQGITVPTLVLHGEDDTLLPPPHGRHTHELIEGSKLVIYPGMGHNLPVEVVPQIISAMSAHFLTVAAPI